MSVSPAWSTQSDNLLSYLTVEETLMFTAQLALKKHSIQAIRKKVKFHTFCIYLFSFVFWLFCLDSGRTVIVMQAVWPFYGRGVYLLTELNLSGKPQSLSHANEIWSQDLLPIRDYTVLRNTVF